MPRTDRPDSLRTYIDELESTGRRVFTSADARRTLGLSDAAFQRAAHRLSKQRRLFSPHHGFYVIVPLIYRRQGVIPAELFIAELMRFLDRPYYVGVLSAAALHGAAHQQPMELQVVTDRPMRMISRENMRVRFLVKKEIHATETVEMKTDAGMLRVSTPEATAFDVVRYVRWAGGWHNVATVLVELADAMDGDRLAAAASAADIATVQRVGFLLERFAEGAPIAALATVTEKRSSRYVKLRPDVPAASGAERSQRWRTIINESIEPDIT